MFENHGELGFDFFFIYIFEMRILLPNFIKHCDRVSLFSFSKLLINLFIAKKLTKMIHLYTFV